MSEKLVAVDHLRPLMRKHAVLFGATILSRGIRPNLAARTLIDLYNAKGVFDNRDDDLDSLSRGLRQRFDVVEILTQGLVACSAPPSGISHDQCLGMATNAPARVRSFAPVQG
jgi:hypothetical protein